MNKNIHKLISHFAEKQKTLFLIDSAGALLTAFFLFVIMRQFNEHFEMPEPVLIYLSAIAICFCIYSASCFLFVRERWVPFLRGVGMANLLYGVLTTFLVIQYYPLLTTPGIVYFLTEIVIIFGLGYVELNVAAVIHKRIWK